jgi:hypothetical protein
MIDLRPRNFLLGAVSQALRLYPAFLKASLLLQRFVQ